MGWMSRFTLLKARIIAMKDALMNKMTLGLLLTMTMATVLRRIIKLNLKQRASKMRQSPVVNHF